MQAFKMFVGSGFFIAALLTGGLALLGFSSLGTETLRNFCFASVLIAMAIGLTRSGWLLIAKRILPLSGKARVLIALSICLFFGFVAVFIIPSFVAGSLGRGPVGCINNLRQIDGAKNEWALENGKTNGDACTENDIKPYIKLDSNGNIPKCPQGGTYTVGRVGEDPKCSIGIYDWPNTHALNYQGSWWIDVKMAYGKLFGLSYAKTPAQDLKNAR